MKKLRKLLAKAEKPFRPRGRGRVQKSSAQETESPPAIDNNRLAGPSKNADPPSSYQSSPASLGDRTHAPEIHPVEAQDAGRSALTGVSIQPTNSDLASSPQVNIPVPSLTPWEAWTLDQDFLFQVYDWNLKHPENNLNRIFKRFSTGTQQHEVLFELVPDGPIPIRGFVKALAHIVKLGISMADAKAAALQFAQSVLLWVEQLANALGAGGNGGFISSAWENLADIREWIEDVCTWAQRMLNVKLIERASVNNKILEFQQQFTQAIERFGVISNIHIGIGQDHIRQRLDSLNMHVSTVQKHVNQIEDRLPQRQQSMPDATYKFQNKIPCDPGTRKLVLEEIMNWICDISEGSPCFFWLSGDPGVGKSAVTASTAQECKRRTILWAQFFINRNDANTIDPQIYFPSIVKQMSNHKPAVGDAIQSILKVQPDLMNDDMAVQATELFLKAVRVASESSPEEPIAIVIDALDETDVKRLKVTAEIFSRILVDLPRNVKVFISSRVEDVIRDNFAHHPRARNIHLSARTSVADVTQFLETKVQEIMAEYKIKWSEWGQERMQKLCSQASGLFIWAVTAIEYIRSEIEESGRECLDLVLDELNAKGMDNINVLYRAILKRTYRRETDPWQTQRFRRIVGAILVQQSPLSIADLQGLLNLRNPTNDAPVDIKHFVRRLRTLLVAGVAEINDRTFPRVHKSFADFITSPKAEEFRVDMTESNGELALQCLDRLVRLKDDEMPTQLRYAISHWSSHLTHMAGVPVEVEEKDEYDTGSSNDAQSLISHLEKDAGSSVPGYAIETEELPDDARDIYFMCVSPDRSHIAYSRLDENILLRDIEAGSFTERTLAGHEDTVLSATFSQDGRYIVSASRDYCICVWDVETGEQLGGGLLRGHEGKVYSAYFSPDGSQMVSASLDRTIRIWDAMTGRVVRVLKGHTQEVWRAVFSSDARHIVSTSVDKTVRVWNALTGDEVHAFTDPPTAGSAFFSQDSKHIISRTEEEIIAWDFETRERVPNSCIDGASLSFTKAGSEPYIVTPQMSNTALQSATPLYSFCVNIDRDLPASRIIACGIGNDWCLGSLNFIISRPCFGQLFISCPWSRSPKYVESDS